MGSEHQGRDGPTRWCIIKTDDLEHGHDDDLPCPCPSVVATGQGDGGVPVTYHRGRRDGDEVCVDDLTVVCVTIVPVFG